MDLFQSMQLPEELERIVREFSKPLLRYPREYKLAVAADEWPELKQKLSSPEADQVIGPLRQYLDAKDQSRTYGTIYQDTVVDNPCELSREEQYEIMSTWIKAMRNERNIRRVLDALIA